MPAWKIAFGELISEGLAVFIHHRDRLLGGRHVHAFTIPVPTRAPIGACASPGGLAVTIAIYVTRRGPRGLTPNPAVTLASSAVSGFFPWRKVLPL